MMTQRLPIAILSLLLATAPGCSVRKSASHVMGAVAWHGQGVLEREEDVELARETTPALIKSLEVLAQSDAADPVVAALLAKAFGQYAYGFYEEDLLRYKFSEPARAQISLQRADRFYDLGKNYGLGALRRRGLGKGIDGSYAEFEQGLQRLGKRDVPLLFWTAFCWAGSINLHRDDPAAVADLPRAAAMVDRVVALVPSYADGSAWSFQGVIAAARPVMLGGDPTAARADFERAIDAFPQYLMHRVLMAQYYAVQTQDRALFRAQLDTVLEGKPAAMPEQRLANELAKRRARVLLAQEENLF